MHGNACDGMCEDEDEDDDDDKDDIDCDKVNSYDRIGKDSRPREARPKNLVYIYIYIDTCMNECNNIHIYIYTVWHEESDFQVKIEQILRLEVKN